MEQSFDPQEFHKALDAFIQTTTMEDGLKILQQNPALLEDHADILLSTIIASARKQGDEVTATALDERRDFIRSIRQELLEKEGKISD
ncbi:hypothetical protein [Candidatus Parabeggiatoa sp. HSG14]|uniref:hypothetical protein n=1 Tax=Candidatus Parabeggiatoa sp. HSG14 TaxID=3055593 RepID=UPI0025A7232E|nr:hypothetical protein [Thiotrichales bacterium HSG14]